VADPRALQSSATKKSSEAIRNGWPTKPKGLNEMAAVQPPDVENRLPGGAGGLKGAIFSPPVPGRYACEGRNHVAKNPTSSSTPSMKKNR
jgi:hypothetical protein